MHPKSAATKNCHAMAETKLAIEPESEKLLGVKVLIPIEKSEVRFDDVSRETSATF